MLHTRYQDHLSRKIFHMFSATLATFIFLYILDRVQSIVTIVSITAILFTLDLLRLRYERLNSFALRWMGWLMRENERHEPSAQLYYLMGLCFCGIFLPKPVAVQAMLTLAWMDPTAGIVGVRFGKHTWNSIFRHVFIDMPNLPIDLGAKTIEGSMAGVVVAILAGILAWTGPWAGVPYVGAEGSAMWWPSAGIILILALVGGVAAMIAEAWPSQWDDNINIPFWCGIVVWATSKLMGVPIAWN